jgi:hypothetical protein
VKKKTVSLDVSWNVNREEREELRGRYTDE